MTVTIKLIGGLKLLKGIMHLSDDILLLLKSPEEALKRTKDMGFENQGLYLYVFLSAFLGFSLGGALSSVTGGWLIMPVIFALVVLVVSFLKLLLWSVISYIVALAVFGGKGTFTGTLKMMGFSAAPFIIGIFAFMTLTLLQTVFTSTLLMVIMYIWVIMIAAAAVDAEHEIGYGRAFLSVFGLPATVMMLLIMLVGVF